MMTAPPPQPPPPVCSATCQPTNAPESNLQGDSSGCAAHTPTVPRRPPTHSSPTAPFWSRCTAAARTPSCSAATTTVRMSGSLLVPMSSSLLVPMSTTYDENVQAAPCRARAPQRQSMQYLVAPLCPPSAPSTGRAELANNRRAGLSTGGVGLCAACGGRCRRGAAGRVDSIVPAEAAVVVI